MSNVNIRWQIYELINRLTSGPYTPEHSILVDRLLVLLETIDAKRMDRILENRPNGPFSFVGVGSPTVGTIFGESIKPKENMDER